MSARVPPALHRIKTSVAVLMKPRVSRLGPASHRIKTQQRLRWSHVSTDWILRRTGLKPLNGDDVATCENISFCDTSEQNSADDVAGDVSVTWQVTRTLTVRRCWRGGSTRPVLQKPGEDGAWRAYGALVRVGSLDVGACRRVRACRSSVLRRVFNSRFFWLSSTRWYV